MGGTAVLRRACIQYVMGHVSDGATRTQCDAIAACKEGVIEGVEGCTYLCMTCYDPTEGIGNRVSGGKCRTPQHSCL